MVAVGMKKPRPQHWRTGGEAGVTMGGVIPKEPKRILAYFGRIFKSAEPAAPTLWHSQPFMPLMLALGLLELEANGAAVAVDNFPAT